MRIPVLFVTYNRIGYSQKALTALASNASVPIELNIWDNGSGPETVQWLKEMDAHKDGVATYWGTDVWISEIVFNSENRGLAVAMNWFFRKYATQPYVVKVDNDTVLPKDWLKDLLEGMEIAREPMRLRSMSNKVGAVSPTCLRPNGDTFKEWVRKHMVSDDCGNGYQLHYNSYILGTGVLINMDMIRERGLMFEKFPYGPQTTTVRSEGEKYPRPIKTCLISGWGAYQRVAADYDGWKFAFYSKVHANLLNLKEEHVLSNDYPEYDEELRDARDQGNAWWESVGGVPGVKKYVDEHGGLEKLSDTSIADNIVRRTNERLEQLYNSATFSPPRKVYLTDCEHYERSTQAWWEERVRREGVSRAIFLDQSQSRTNEFTEIHLRIIRQELKGLHVLEVGCGWGRMSADIAKVAASFVGTDFVEELLVKARETLPKLDFFYADAGELPFEGGSFDAVVAVTCVSSFDERFNAVMKEMLRVVKKGGFVLLLEEEWVPEAVEVGEQMSPETEAKIAREMAADVSLYRCKTCRWLGPVPVQQLFYIEGRKDEGFMCGFCDAPGLLKLENK